VKVLFFGDIVGRSGREAVKYALPRLMREFSPDFVIANAENATHGNGLLPEMGRQLLDLGIDALTMGNHTWDQKQIVQLMEATPRVIRPANYPDTPAEKAPGRGSVIIECARRSGLRLGLIQAMGRVFIEEIDCPFRAADNESYGMETLGVKCVVIDFHAEATSEKQAFAYFMDGKASAVIGTHCHVQTADNHIMKGGTAMITDVGMCGCFDSVIGIKKEISIRRFMTKRHIKYEPADGIGGVNAVVVEIDEATGRALSISRINERVVDRDDHE